MTFYNRNVYFIDIFVGVRDKNFWGDMFSLGVIIHETKHQLVLSVNIWCCNQLGIGVNYVFCCIRVTEAIETMRNSRDNLIE